MRARYIDYGEIPRRIVDQYAPDAAPGVTVGDASWITYAISELDLGARRFEGARASVFIG